MAKGTRPGDPGRDEHPGETFLTDVPVFGPRPALTMYVVWCPGCDRAPECGASFTATKEDPEAKWRCLQCRSVLERWMYTRGEEPELARGMI